MNTQTKTPATMVKVPSAETQEKTTLELLKEVESLKSKLETLPKSFEEKTLFYSQKQSLINRHAKLEAYQKQIEELAEDLKKENDENNFSSQEYHIEIYKKQSNYKDDSIAKITNPVIIKDVISFIMLKIADRLQVYKTLIEA
ncbi:MAG: hypothetical protein H7296_07525 [Bacteroidia bacterium]|nr:hypothetical protein [Bacteroidia bacterium]